GALAMMSPLLAVRDLTVSVNGREGQARLLDSVGFDLEAGQTLAVVGESGAGKTTLCRALIGLLPREVSARGSMSLRGQELVGLRSAQWRAIRGRQIAMVFQDPSRALNPILRVGEQIAAALRLHRGLDREQAKAA